MSTLLLLLALLVSSIAPSGSTVRSMDGSCTDDACIIQQGTDTGG